jgi:hypothetical protein
VVARGGVALPDAAGQPVTVTVHCQGMTSKPPAADGQRRLAEMRDPTPSAGSAFFSSKQGQGSLMGKEERLKAGRGRRRGR